MICRVQNLETVLEGILIYYRFQGVRSLLKIEFFNSLFVVMNCESLLIESSK